MSNVENKLKIELIYYFCFSFARFGQPQSAFIESDAHSETEVAPYVIRSIDVEHACAHVQLVCDVTHEYL